MISTCSCRIRRRWSKARVLEAQRHRLTYRTSNHTISNLNLIGPTHHYQWSSSSSTTSSGSSSFSHQWRRFVQKRYDNEWSKRNVIEEGDCEEEDQPVVFYMRLEVLLLFGLLVVALFASICVVMWGIYKKYEADVAIQSLEFDDFYTVEGMDRGGVPTKLVTVNSSLTIWVHNSAPSLGIHVEPVVISIQYSNISIATGHSKMIYLPDEAQRTMPITIRGDMVPLYGGAEFPELTESIDIPLMKEFSLTGKRYVMGKLVKTTHHRSASCGLVYNSQKNKHIKFSNSSCIYN